MRKDGRIQKTWTDDTGRRHFVCGYSEAEVLKKIENEKRDFQEGKFVINKRTTVSEWAYKAVKAYKTNQKPITRKTYLERMEHTILENIGSMPLCKVLPLHCQNVLNLQAGNSKWQIAEVNRMMKFIFGKAVENHLIPTNPAANLTKPLGYEGEGRECTPREREAFYSALSKDEKLMPFRFMIECGCRPGEAFEIKGTDFKMMNGYPMLHIRGTKNKYSDRLVPCPLDLFNKYKGKHFNLCFTTSTGHPIGPNERKPLYKKLYRAMNIEMGCTVYRNQLMPPFPLADDFEPYCFRHTYATDLARKKIDIRICQKLMGHKDLTMLSKIYTHVQTEDLLKEASQILASY